VEIGKRKVGLYAIAGVLIAAIIIAGVFMSGLRFPVLTAQTGKLVVLLTDAPVKNLTRLEVTINGFSVIGETGEMPLPFANGDEEFYIYDLLALSNVTEVVSTAEIPAGNYTKMRMTIKDAKAHFGEDDVRSLGVPPGHIDIIVHFEIEDGATTVIIIDMEADWVAISKTNQLRPVLKVKSVTVS
jgi:hypothetical protein